MNEWMDGRKEGWKEGWKEGMRRCITCIINVLRKS